MNPLSKPSFYALAITGIISFILVLLFVNNFKLIKNLPIDKLILVVSLVGAVIGIHGLLHLGMEYTYNYNPLDMFFEIR
jgi:hypothetical protein